MSDRPVAPPGVGDLLSWLRSRSGADRYLDQAGAVDVLDRLLFIDHRVAMINGELPLLTWTVGKYRNLIGWVDEEDTAKTRAAFTAWAAALGAEVELDRRYPGDPNRRYLSGRTVIDGVTVVVAADIVAEVSDCD